MPDFTPIGNAVIEGELPDVTTEDTVIFIGCDYTYFREHAIFLAFSCHKFSPGSILHFHVFNPAPDFDQIYSLLLIALPDIRWTVTYDHEQPPLNDDAKRTYYACERFIRLNEIFHKAPACYFQLDADSLIRGPVSSILDYSNNADVSLVERAIDDKEMKFLAGGILLKPTESARSFTASVANKIQHDFDINNYSWFLDQVAIFKTIKEMEKSDPSFKTNQLPDIFLDWEFRDNSIVWTGKGERKFNDQKYVDLYKSLWNDTLIDNICANFWSVESNLHSKKILIVTPRLDVPFKKTPLISAEVRANFRTQQTAELRQYWADFARSIQKSLIANGTNAKLLTIDNWRITADLVNALNPDAVLIPHRQKFQIEGINAPTWFYMQIVFKWLFSLDTQGWGAGSSAYPCINYTSGDTNSNVYDQYVKKLQNKNDSKFLQPEKVGKSELISRGVIPDEPYIFFPCQIPHDETLKYFSDLDETTIIRNLSEWANRESVHVVFKEHPANPASMAPLREVGTGPYIHWSNASIHELIEHAVAVYTVNGGTGLEAILHGKPVVTFGRVEYDVVTIKGNIGNLEETWSQVTSWDTMKGISKYRQFMDWYCRSFAVDLSNNDNLVSRTNTISIDIINALGIYSGTPTNTPPPQLPQTAPPSSPPTPGNPMQRIDGMFHAFRFLHKSETEGDYYEFGCYNGGSLINAVGASFHYSNTPRHFYAFDSFEGLPELTDDDKLQGYGIFEEGEYSCSKEQVIKNITEAGVPESFLTCIEGYFDTSLSDPETAKILGPSKAALVHIDCDLYSSAVPVLDFISNRMVDGAILMFDDWFCYRGRPDRGVARAFHEWKGTAPYAFTEYCRYSWCGIAFICNTLNTNNYVTDE